MSSSEDNVITAYLYLKKERSNFGFTHTILEMCAIAHLYLQMLIIGM